MAESPKIRPDYFISPLFGRDGHVGLINCGKLSLLAHMARDEEDVKKKTASIPGSGFRRIKKKRKTGLIESKCPFAVEHEEAAACFCSRPTSGCHFQASDFGFLRVLLNAEILWCVGSEVLTSRLHLAALTTARVCRSGGPSDQNRAFSTTFFYFASIFKPRNGSLAVNVLFIPYRKTSEPSASMLEH